MHTLNLPKSVLYFVTYLFGWLSGLIVLLLEKQNSQVRLHAAQATVIFGLASLAGIVLPVIPIVGTIMLALLGLLVSGFWFIQLLLAILGQPVILTMATPLYKKLLAMPWFNEHR